MKSFFGRNQNLSDSMLIQVKRKGFKKNYFSDIFHFVLAISWFEFFIINTVLYISMNLFFAFLYFIGGETIINADPNSYWDAFVFSFQTSTTIGYGHFLPANQYADMVVIFDTLSGIIFVAITTGLAFAKFSRPTARLAFTENCVIHSYEGEQTLMFRVANARDSHIADASIEAIVVMSDVSQEGLSMQRIWDLKLVRSKSPMLFLSWSVMHKINNESPLKGLTLEELKKRNARIVISLTGIDDWSSQQVHTNHIYRNESFVYNYRFDDILINHDDGSITMDYKNFNRLLPMN